MPWGAKVAEKFGPKSTETMMGKTEGKIPEDIKNLKFIYHLVKERGFTLEGAKTHLKEEKKKTLNNFEIISKLEGIKNQLSKIKNQL